MKIYIYFFNKKIKSIFKLCLTIMIVGLCQIGRIAMLDCVSQKKTKIIIDYALDSKELLKTFVLQRILQHPALEKAMFPAYPILSSCWANRQISS